MIGRCACRGAEHGDGRNLALCGALIGARDMVNVKKKSRFPGAAKKAADSLIARDDRWLLPEGIEELLPDEAERLERLRRRLLDLFASWGYRLVIPPIIEHLESLLVGTGRDLELQTFKLTDQLTGRLLGVRADMTPQVARIDAHRLKSTTPATTAKTRNTRRRRRHRPRTATTGRTSISAMAAWSAGSPTRRGSTTIRN